MSLESLADAVANNRASNDAASGSPRRGLRILSQQFSGKTWRRRQPEKVRVYDSLRLRSG
jgi:hypothetical protein